MFGVFELASPGIAGIAIVRIVGTFGILRHEGHEAKRPRGLERLSLNDLLRLLDVVDCRNYSNGVTDRGAFFDSNAVTELPAT